MWAGRQLVSEKVKLMWGGKTEARVALEELVDWRYHFLAWWAAWCEAGQSAV